MSDGKRRAHANVIDFRTAAHALRKDKEGVAMRSDETGSAVTAVRNVVTLKKHPAVKAMMDRIPSWITPNGITYFRTLLVIPVVYLLMQEMFFAALTMFVVSMLLDAVDGALAEARDAQSEFGAFLDPLGDKIFICTTLLTCLLFVPQTFMVPVAAICCFAVILTMVRIVRMAKRSHRYPMVVEDAPKKSVAAKTAGKYKTITETVSLVLLLAILGAATPDLLIVPLVTLSVAALLGGASLFSQLAR
ncbi:CDP-alcohol phosphatidyltransferase family protein [Patescibacteria group bacterium]